MISSTISGSSHGDKTPSVNNRLILGIESAIGGGSIALYREGNKLSSWTGDEPIARAEALLPNIERILADNGLTIRDLTHIVVSKGPGSFTGIRVGLATVLGLRAALPVKCLGLTALEALSLSIDAASVCVVPVGRGYVCFQRFVDPVDGPSDLLTLEECAERLVKRGAHIVVAHGSIAETLADLIQQEVIYAGSDIAGLLCSAVDSKFASTDLTPLFSERRKIDR